MTDEADSRGNWQAFRADIRRRTFTPFRKVTFFFYFVAAIVGVSGLGVILELVLLGGNAGSVSNVRTALATYAFGIIGSSALHAFIGDNIEKQLKVFAFIILAVASGLMAWIVFDRGLADSWALFWGGVGSLLALWFWCVVNADDPLFNDTTIRAPTGGDDVTIDLPGADDLSDFQA